uniref:Uncharacterized protein n=1 Tax=mine drainage metagenome TaxID=410659 RepID=E6PXF1_9ZZZZ
MSLKFTSQTAYTLIQKREKTLEELFASIPHPEYFSE